MNALFFDKDGTLVDCTGFPKIIPSDNVWIDRTVNGLLRLQEKYALFIVSNQGWIATGRMSENRAHEIFASVLSQYASHGVRFQSYEFCPHDKKEGCTCRKPLPGMLERIAQRHAIDRSSSYFIGDMETDVLAGQAFGCQTAVVETEGTYKGTIQPNILVPDVNAFADALLGTKT